jgi:acetyl-CoA C-acetyltransferase
MKNRVYILGGHQTDFAQNWSRSDLDLFDVFKDTVKNGLLKTNLEPSDIDVAHLKESQPQDTKLLVLLEA